MRLAIVGLGQGIALDLNNNLAHFSNELIAVGHVKGDLVKVGIGVGELIRGKVHRIFSDDGSLRLSITAEGEVSLGIQFIVRRDIVTRHDMLFAIIDIRMVMARDGNSRLDRVDLLITVGYLEGHLGEVLVRVLELLLRQAHVRLAIGVFALNHVRALRFRGAGELEVLLHIVELIVRLGDILSHGMLRAIIIVGGVVTGDGHDNLVRDGRDRQRAGNNSDRDVRVVLRRGGEVGLGHGHLVLARVRALRRRLLVVLRNAGERDGRVILAHRVAVDALLRTVVDLRVAVAGYGDLVLVRDGRDLQRARHNGDLDVRVVVRRGGEVGLAHGHRIGAHVGALRRRLRVVLLNAGELDGLVILAHGVAADALLAAVVDLRVALAGHGDLVLVRDGISYSSVMGVMVKIPGTKVTV